MNLPYVLISCICCARVCRSTVERFPSGELGGGVRVQMVPGPGQYTPKLPHSSQLPDGRPLKTAAFRSEVRAPHVASPPHVTSPLHVPLMVITNQFLLPLV